MKAYAAYLFSVLLFYTGGIIGIMSGSAALDCTAFAIALNKRRKSRSNRDE